MRVLRSHYVQQLQGQHHQFSIPKVPCKITKRLQVSLPKLKPSSKKANYKDNNKSFNNIVTRQIAKHLSIDVPELSFQSMEPGDLKQINVTETTILARESVLSEEKATAILSPNASSYSSGYDSEENQDNINDLNLPKSTAMESTDHDQLKEAEVCDLSIEQDNPEQLVNQAIGLSPLYLNDLDDHVIETLLPYSQQIVNNESELLYNQNVNCNNVSFPSPTAQQIEGTESMLLYSEQIVNIQTIENIQTYELDNNTTTDDQMEGLPVDELDIENCGIDNINNEFINTLVSQEDVELLQHQSCVEEIQHEQDLKITEVLNNQTIEYNKIIQEQAVELQYGTESAKVNLKLTIEFREVGNRWLTRLYKNFENELWKKSLRENNANSSKYTKYFYHCLICKEKYYCSFDSLKSHINGHLDLFPHGCKLCMQQYVSRRILRSHFKHTHDIENGPYDQYTIQQ